MQASVAAVHEARTVNRHKGRRLTLAFRMFGAAVLATVGLGIAVAVHVATDTSSWRAQITNSTVSSHQPSASGQEPPHSRG